MSDERAKGDLEGLLSHAGWLRFANYARQEWRERLDDKVRSAANNTDDTTALHQIRQILVARDAIERLLAWPQEQLTRLTTEETKEKARTTEGAPMSRRGGL